MAYRRSHIKESLTGRRENGRKAWRRRGAFHTTVSRRRAIKRLSSNFQLPTSKFLEKMSRGSQDTSLLILANSSSNYGLEVQDTEPTCSEIGDISEWDTRETTKADIGLLKISLIEKVVNLGLAEPLWINCELIDLAFIIPQIEKPRSGGENGVRFFLTNTITEEVNQMFSTKSKSKLMGCHTKLQELFEEVCKTHDCTILEGYRDKKRQDEAYKSGLSKLKFPQSKHNRFPSHAIDVIPYPIDFSDVKRIYNFGFFVLETARKMKINIRWGGDWDGDGDTRDQKFNDLVHFELVS